MSSGMAELTTRQQQVLKFVQAALQSGDPAPTLRASKAPLLVIFGELDTPEGVKANVSAIRQIMDQAGRRDYTVKVYPNGSHNLMEVPPDNPNEFVRLQRFPPDFFEMMVDWTTTQVRRRRQVLDH